MSVSTMALFISIKCYYAQCHYAKCHMIIVILSCHSAKCHYAECRGPCCLSIFSAVILKCPSKKVFWTKKIVFSTQSNCLDGATTHNTTTLVKKTLSIAIKTQHTVKRDVMLNTISVVMLSVTILM
jgi:hypothetical protein